MQRQFSGFSAIELLMTLLIAAVIVVVALPHLLPLIGRFRLSAQVNAFYHTLIQARSESIRRNLRVSICPSDDQLSCTGGRAWTTGWITFVDPNRNGQREANEPLLFSQLQSSSDLVILGQGRVARYISYTPYGSTRTAAGALQIGSVSFCYHEIAQKIIINMAGRPRIQRDAHC